MPTTTSRAQYICRFPFKTAISCYINGYASECDRVDGNYAFLERYSNQWCR